MSYGCTRLSGPTIKARPSFGKTVPAKSVPSSPSRWVSNRPGEVVKVDSRAERVAGVFASRYASIARSAAVSCSVARIDAMSPTSAPISASRVLRSAVLRCTAATDAETTANTSRTATPASERRKRLVERRCRSSSKSRTDRPAPMKRISLSVSCSFRASSSSSAASSRDPRYSSESGRPAWSQARAAPARW